jgi:hypothetical protein
MSKQRHYEGCSREVEFLEHRGAEYPALLCLYRGTCACLAVAVLSACSTVRADGQAETLSAFCYSCAQLKLGIC